MGIRAKYHRSWRACPHPLSRCALLRERVRYSAVGTSASPPGRGRPGGLGGRAEPAKSGASTTTRDCACPARGRGSNVPLPAKAIAAGFSKRPTHRPHVTPHPGCSPVRFPCDRQLNKWVHLNKGLDFRSRSKMAQNFDSKSEVNRRPAFLAFALRCELSSIGLIAWGECVTASPANATNLAR